MARPLGLLRPFVGTLYHKVLSTVAHTTKKELPPIVLYVERVYNHMIEAIRTYEVKTGRRFRIALLHDQRKKLDRDTEVVLDRLDLVLSANLNDPYAIQKMLLPYAQEIAAVSCRSEAHIPNFAKVIPNLPYLLTPTESSLVWAHDKLATRQRLSIAGKHLCPPFMVVEDSTETVIKDIEERVGYPLIVKPSWFAGSRLVNCCYHRDELETVLKKVFQRVNVMHKEQQMDKPPVLVEKFMEGEMYSIDGYVDAQGEALFCPMVYVKTGKRIGFDDFFGYLQITPTQLKKESIARAESAARAVIRALGLRNTTAHVELFRTHEGWKIIEVGPRMGGFRHMLYEHAFGLNHTMNDLLIRMGERPEMPKKKKPMGYAAAMKFYARAEGRLVKLTGIKKAKKLSSFRRLYLNKEIGDRCLFAKHGGTSVFNIILHNTERSELLADIRRLEKMMKIETK